MNICRAIPGISLMLMAAGVAAQGVYPERPIRVVVGFPPGGPADTVARLVGQPLGAALGTSIVVENAAGAAGNIAAERVAKATPDGYTLGLVTEAQMLINHSLYKLAHDPTRDFAPISQVAVSQYMLVIHNAVPAKSVQELVALARSQPASLTFASAGTGSTPHMAAELFKTAAGVDIRHIPYKGVAPALSDLLGARVTMMFCPMATGLPVVRDGKLRALAVTSMKRASAAPELASMAESGYPGFDVTGWLALVAPVRTSPTIARKLHVEVTRALALRDVQAKLAGIGLDAVGGSPEELSNIIKLGIGKWTKVIKDAGITAD
jgi:tripartite-type tricarboxylate transporter receptor subunit TctC